MPFFQPVWRPAGGAGNRWIRSSFSRTRRDLVKFIVLRSILRYLIHTRQIRIKPEFPQIAGLEAAGVIESVGAGVTLKPGSRVAFLWLKTWAEYVILLQARPSRYLLISGDKAAQAVLNPFTAWGLLERVNLRSGEWLLLTAGNSGVPGCWYNWPGQIISK